MENKLYSKVNHNVVWQRVKEAPCGSEIRETALPNSWRSMRGFPGLAVGFTCSHFTIPLPFFKIIDITMKLSLFGHTLTSFGSAILRNPRLLLRQLRQNHSLHPFQFPPQWLGYFAQSSDSSQVGEDSSWLGNVCCTVKGGTVRGREVGVEGVIFGE